MIGLLVGLASLASLVSACDGGPSPTTKSAGSTKSTGSTLPHVSVPQGWATYTYGKVAISVPSTWEVKHDTNCPNTDAPGALLLGYPKVLEYCPEYSAVSFVAVIDIPAGSDSGPTSEKPTMINGVPVDVGFGSPSTAVWTVPSLGIEITGTGSKVKRIFHTLRRT